MSSSGLSMLDGLNQRQRGRRMLSEENGVNEWLESWGQGGTLFHGVYALSSSRRWAVVLSGSLGTLLGQGYESLSLD